MRIFFDTNIILEYLFNRKEAEIIKDIFHYLHRMKIEKMISSGSFYTLTYLIESYLKKEGWEKETRILELRRILKGLLCEYMIAGDLDWEAGVEDSRFADLEDSYQYQAALSSGCDLLLTLNVQDFKNVISDSSLHVCSPSEFVDKYPVIE